MEKRMLAVKQWKDFMMAYHGLWLVDRHRERDKDRQKTRNYYQWPY